MAVGGGRQAGMSGHSRTEMRRGVCIYAIYASPFLGSVQRAKAVASVDSGGVCTTIYNCARTHSGSMVLPCIVHVTTRHPPERHVPALESQAWPNAQ